MRACPPSGRGRGTGPDGDKFRRGGTQETLGGAEAKRSPEEGLCPVLAKRPDIKKKPAKNLFLVGLLFFLASLAQAIRLSRRKSLLHSELLWSPSALRAPSRISLRSIHPLTKPRAATGLQRSSERSRKRGT